MIIDDDIVILKEIKYRDNDKILHALSRNNGKIQILARGCRKNKSPLVNVAQILSYSKASLYVNRDMHIINSAELIDNFYNIRNNLEAFLYSTYILELLGYVAQENEFESNIFDMTIKLFKIFNTIASEKDRIKCLVSVYEIKLISMLGFKPQISNCIECGKPIGKDDYVYFNMEEGGVQCGACNNMAYKIRADIRGLSKLENIINERLDSEELCKYVDRNIEILIRRYLFEHIGKSNFITLRLIKESFN